MIQSLAVGAGGPWQYNRDYGISVHRDDNAERGSHIVRSVGWRGWGKRYYVNPSFTQRNQLDLFKSPRTGIIEQGPQQFRAAVCAVRGAEEDWVHPQATPEYSAVVCG